MTTTDLATRNGTADLAPRWAMSLDDLRQQVRDLAEFKNSIMDKGTDYDIIPGTPKPSLFKPGAEKLCQVFGLATDFRTVNKIEDWDRPLFHYEVECRLVRKATGEVVGNGLGSANSMEGRYRWRKAERECPNCGEAAIIKGRAEYGGGWLCFGKKGGCGSKWTDGSPEIEKQETGRVENDDVFTLVNTLLKMAQKRALVAATLVATAASGIFTQDVEDLDLGGPHPQGPQHTHEQPDVVDGEAREVPAGGNPPTGAAATPSRRAPNGSSASRAASASGTSTETHRCALCNTEADCVADREDWICRDRAACAKRRLDAGEAPSPKSGPAAGAHGGRAGAGAPVEAAGAGDVAGGGDRPAVPDLTAALRPLGDGLEEFSCEACGAIYAKVETRNGLVGARKWLEFIGGRGATRPLCVTCAKAERPATAKAA